PERGEVARLERASHRFVVLRPLTLERSEAGIASHGHEGARRERERYDLSLCHRAHRAGELAPAPAMDRPPLQQGLPALDPAQAQERAQQRALARPVRPEHRVERTGSDIHRYISQGGGGRPRVPDRDPVRGDSHDAPVLRRRSTRKNGTPTNAVMTPMGISVGASARRAARSASVRNAAPARKESGRRERWSEPTSSRTAWGTTRPTKPITPATATPEAVISAATARDVRLTPSTSAPRWCAVSSPIASRLSDLANPRRTTTAGVV